MRGNLQVYRGIKEGRMIVVCLLGIHKWKLVKSESKIQERYDSPFPHSIYYHEVPYILEIYQCLRCGGIKERMKF